VSSRTDPFDGVSLYGSQPVNDGEEHRVSVVFEAGKSVRLFVDGVEDKSARVIGKVPGTIAISNRPLAIGVGYRNDAGAKAYRFEGDLKDVRLYGRALGKELGSGEAGERVAELMAALGGGKSEGKEVSVPVMREMSKPRDTFIHLRGSFLSRGDQVGPAVPRILANEGEAQAGNRLEFARWLVNGKNPLVARVVVNRFWQSYFGHGLVRTSDDFGSQGTPPTHPDLLDWLASEFVESGWDMKHINRLIVTSATYRQAARISSVHREKDPNNEMFARMPRVRLPAEQIRDQALAIGGLLKPLAGGPSVFPPQPDRYWEDRDLPGKWVASKDDDRYRKSLYTYWRRMALHPTMELLDAPARAVCVSKRTTANLPTQALVTLNAPVFVESAEGLVKRLLLEPGDQKARLDLAFRLCLGRRPAPAEQIKFIGFLENHPSKSKDAAWVSVATILLNLDETITRP
jgi:hypothetical protein